MGYCLSLSALSNAELCWSIVYSMHNQNFPHPKETHPQGVTDKIGEITRNLVKDLTHFNQKPHTDSGSCDAKVNLSF